MRSILLTVAMMILFHSGGATAASLDAPSVTGTAFFISDNGMVVTNYHVIKDCKRLMLFDPQAGWTAEARIVDVDAANDLALLQADIKSRPLPVADQFVLKRGEEVLTLGFPSPDIQGASQKATFGRINAVSGIGDDIRHVQVDVPVQPGNSGGPLLNVKGEVVGVINARLQGNFQNVSYAVKVDYLRPLLDMASIKTTTASFLTSSSMASVVERSQNSVVMVLGYVMAKPSGTGESQAKSKDAPGDKLVQRMQHHAELGDAIAQRLLGHMYLEGKRIAKDATKAAEWFRKAAEQGDAEAQVFLGRMYNIGEGVAKDAAKAAEWVRKAAEQGDANAQYYLGVMYTTDNWAPKDEAKAAEWFRKAAEWVHQAAEQGDADAQRQLGRMYATGEGVPKDEAKAAEWYHKAAEQGHADAQSILGGMYYRGKGVKKNMVKAAEWYRKAAEQGDRFAQYLLGSMYVQGRGVIQDRQKGCYWLRTAGEQGDELAIEEYNELCVR